MEQEPLLFDWETLVPKLVHPVKVAVVEALCYIGEPLSPTELSRLFEVDEYYLSAVSYHVNMLVKAGILEVKWRRPVRGSEEKFYFFPEAM